MHYDLTPEQLAEFHERFITEFGVTFVGGCCGTTPDHLRAVVERCRDLTPAPRTPEREPGAASMYSHVPYRQENSFLIVGERTNANGSKKFREAMLADDWETCVAMAREQVKEGPTSSTSASTTPAKTAPRTWTRSPAASAPRRPNR